MGTRTGELSEEQVAISGVRLTGVQLLIFAALLHPSVVRAVLPHVLVVAPTLWQGMMITHNLLLVIAVFWVYKSRALGQSRLGRWAFVHRPWVGGLLLSVATLLSWGALGEVFFWQLRRIVPAETKPYVSHDFEGVFHLKDPLFGLRTMPHARAESRARIEPEGEPLYSVVYTSDAHGNRVVPQPDVPKTMHLAAFGCSFMFGDGVNDDETLPAQLACLRPEVAVYCFAQSGYGPGHPVLQIQNGATDCIQEAAGAAVYLFMSDHLNRLMPRPEYMETWVAGHPAFGLDEKGEAQYLGSMREVFSERLQTYALWSGENFVRWSGLRFPLWTRGSDFELAAALLAGARREYQRRFPGNEFYVLIDPVTHVRFNAARLIRALRARGIPVLDAEGVYGPDPWSFYHYPVDRHPMPEANAVLAEWLWGELLLI